MSTIIFYNPGVLDIRGATTMGLSAKENEASAIGKFGTGLKYAIASILRWGGAIEIETGGVKYTFEKRSIEFRGKAHEQIIMHSMFGNDGPDSTTELGYTTHYGSHWEPWQIFRELYSNAKDEGGGVMTDTQFDGVPVNDSTIIRVTCNEIAQCYPQRDNIILPREGDMTSNANIRMIACPSSYLYYRGVRVVDQPCLYTWNFLQDIHLTEDRTAQAYQFEDDIAAVVQASTDRAFIRACLLAPQSKLEGQLPFRTWNTTSDDFVAVANELYKKHGQNKMRAGVMGILRKAFPEIDAPKPVTMTRIMSSQLEKARVFLKKIDMPVDEYPVEVVNLQKNILGQAKDGKVLLSPQVFGQGTKQVVSTWYEELLHLSTGLSDCTYEMQTHLFNRIISLHEELIGEAL